MGEINVHIDFVADKYDAVIDSLNRLFKQCFKILLNGALKYSADYHFRKKHTFAFCRMMKENTDSDDDAHETFISETIFLSEWQEIKRNQDLTFNRHVVKEHQNITHFLEQTGMFFFLKNMNVMKIIPVCNIFYAGRYSFA